MRTIEVEYTINARVKGDNHYDPLVTFTAKTPAPLQTDIEIGKQRYKVVDEMALASAIERATRAFIDSLSRETDQ